MCLMSTINETGTWMVRTTESWAYREIRRIDERLLAAQAPLTTDSSGHTCSLDGPNWWINYTVIQWYRQGYFFSTTCQSRTSQQPLMTMTYLSNELRWIIMPLRFRQRQWWIQRGCSFLRRHRAIFAREIHCQSLALRLANCCNQKLFLSKMHKCLATGSVGSHRRS